MSNNSYLISCKKTLLPWHHFYWIIINSDYCVERATVKIDAPSCYKALRIYHPPVCSLVRGWHLCALQAQEWKWQNVQCRTDIHVPLHLLESPSWLASSATSSISSCFVISLTLSQSFTASDCGSAEDYVILTVETVVNDKFTFNVKMYVTASCSSDKWQMCQSIATLTRLTLSLATLQYHAFLYSSLRFNN